MGTSHYKNITQWSMGDQKTATNQQGDIAIIISYLPGGGRPDAQRSRAHASQSACVACGLISVHLLQSEYTASGQQRGAAGPCHGA
jgi:hypothetical protein